MTQQIVRIGHRDGRRSEVEFVLELKGDKKDYVLRKTGQHQVTLFRLTGHTEPIQ